MGPSMTHRFDSYLVRMKFSILLSSLSTCNHMAGGRAYASEGTWPCASFDSQYLFARALPHRRMLCSCSSVQASRSTDLTRLMCVPMPRWMPEHLRITHQSRLQAWSALAYRMHTKTPRFQLAHRGSAVQRPISRPLDRRRGTRERRTLVPLAVRTLLVALELQQALDRLLILRRALGRPP